MVGKVLAFLNKNYEKITGKRPVTTEIASISRSSLALSYFVGDILINPDRVLSSAHASKYNQEAGLNLYQEMIDKDPQIASCVRSRKKAVLNKPWEIVPASDKRRDHQIAEFVDWAFTYERRRESWYELMDCIPKGFSVSEIMWGIHDQKIIPIDLRGRNPVRFVFDTDYHLRLLTQGAPMQGIELPRNKFIYLRNEPFGENPYGNAALKEIYWYYWFKKSAIKYWMQFLDKFGSPTLLAKYPGAQLNVEQKQALETIIETFQNATGLRVPDGIDLSFLEAARRGEGGYQYLIEYCDQQITKAIHGQTLTSGEGDRVGSMALGRVHEDTKYEYTADDCELLMDGLNSQLIPPIVDYNFAGVKEYPKLVLRYEPDEDLMQEAKRDEVIITRIGLPVSKDHLYEKYGIPKPEENEELVEPPQRGGGLPFVDTGKKKLFAQGIKGYRIASTVKLRSKYIKEIEELLMGLQGEYLGFIQKGEPLEIALEGLILRRYNPEVADILNKAHWESITAGAQSMADQLKLTVNKDVFAELMDGYLDRRVYEMGTIEDMGNTLRDLLTNKAQDLFDQKLTIQEVASQIKKEFPDFADWKAKQIADTEISKAADWAGTQMVKRSGLPVNAWFLIDPASCDICQEWAVHNPYTLRQAESMGLPHPQCNDQWTFTIKEKGG